MKVSPIRDLVSACGRHVEKPKLDLQIAKEFVKPQLEDLADASAFEAFSVYSGIYGLARYYLHQLTNSSIEVGNPTIPR